jgi:hypothetical protein
MHRGCYVRSRSAFDDVALRRAGTCPVELLERLVVLIRSERARPETQTQCHDARPSPKETRARPSTGCGNMQTSPHPLSIVTVLTTTRNALLNAPAKPEPRVGG